MDRLTLRELRRLQADLDREITRQQVAARRRALEGIERLMVDAELTAEEVIAHLGPRRRRKRGKLPAKYRDPENPRNSWAGRGKKPKWLETKLERGAKLEDFRVESSEAKDRVHHDAAKPAGPGAEVGKRPPSPVETPPAHSAGVPVGVEVAR